MNNSASFHFESEITTFQEQKLEKLKVESNFTAPMAPLRVHHLFAHPLMPGGTYYMYGYLLWNYTPQGAAEGIKLQSLLP